MKRDTASTFLALLLVGGVVVMIVLALVGVEVVVGGFKCSSRWPDYETRFSPIAGCQVKVNGRLIPEDHVRVAGGDT